MLNGILPYASLLHETVNPEAKYGKQAESVANRLGLDPKELLAQAIGSDPSPRKEYVGWVLTQVRKKRLMLPEDSHRIRESLHEFHRLKNLGRSHIEKDIHKYPDLAAVEDAIELLLGAQSKRSGGMGGESDLLSLPGVELYREDGLYKIYKVTDANSLAELGEGTKWCTRKSYPDCQAGEYLDEHGHIFLVLKDGKKFAQYTPGYDQVMDVKDRQFEVPKGLAKLMAPTEPTPEIAYHYALHVIGGRWPEAEPEIRKNSVWACLYARYVIKGRWPEGELAISKDPERAYQYARYVMKRERWPEAEPAISKDPQWACLYARNVIQGRWPEAEPTINKNSKWARLYARDVPGANDLVLA